RLQTVHRPERLLLGNQGGVEVGVASARLRERRDSVSNLVAGATKSGRIELATVRGKLLCVGVHERRRKRGARVRDGEVEKVGVGSRRDARLVQERVRCAAEEPCGGKRSSCHLGYAREVGLRLRDAIGLLELRRIGGAGQLVRQVLMTEENLRVRPEELLL